MKTNGKGQRIELGRFIVADPALCHGKPTYKGTSIMVWQVLAMLERGESWDYIRAAWPGRITDSAIAETVRLARASLLISTAAWPKSRPKPRSPGEHADENIVAQQRGGEPMFANILHFSQATGAAETIFGVYSLSDYVEASRGKGGETPEVRSVDAVVVFSSAGLQ